MAKQFPALLPEHEDFIRRQHLFFVGSAPLYGTGTVVLPGSPEWEALYPLFSPLQGARQIITVDIHKVQTSCGYAVPFMTYDRERETLQRWAVQKGEEGLEQYRKDKNAVSLDGIPTPLGKVN
ncbi:hypothetical protein AB6A23_00585 [Paenibacillus tarimensis]